MSSSSPPPTSTSTSTTTTTTTTVSACGKVLLVGGYLVLESPNPGLVLAVDKRFYTTVKTTSNDASTSSNSNNNIISNNITVSSPQFHCTWKYTWVRSSSSSSSSSSAEDDDNDDNNNNNNTASFGGRLEPSLENPSFNTFVENSLTLLCLYLPPDPYEDVHITIQGDNDFYSVLPHLNLKNDEKAAAVDAAVVVRKSTVSNLPKFLPCPKDPITDKVTVNKTGLGSSAALTTSLVGSWCIHFTNNKAIKKKKEEEEEAKEENSTISKDMLDKIHNLAQMCHCWAQGKIGSGFDVSAAVYGTHIYKRFPKCLLSDFLQQIEHHHHGGGGGGSATSGNNTSINKASASTTTNSSSSSTIIDSNEGIQELLKTLVTTTPWKEGMQLSIPYFSSSSSTSAATSNNKSTTTSPPPQLQIVLADVCGGSESPSMAKLVLQWKQLHPLISRPIWNELQKQNKTVMDLINQLSSQEEGGSDNDDYYDTLSRQTSKEWPDDSVFKKLSDTFRNIRSLMKQMGESVGTVIKDGDINAVPIEPNQQTKLCDATMELPGVVAAVVPGAGGYDAIACLYIDRPHVLSSIEELWSTYSINNDNNNNNGVRICPLSAQISTEGLRIE